MVSKIVTDKQQTKTLLLSPLCIDFVYVEKMLKEYVQNELISSSGSYPNLI